MRNRFGLILLQIGIFVALFSGLTSGKPVLAEETSPPTFHDVARNDRYYEAVTFLSEQHIVEGYEDQTFRPYQTISRAEGLKIILESLGETPEESAESHEIVSSFSDVDSEAWYAPYIKMAIEKGIIGGYPDGTFHPEAPLNRAESLKIIALTWGKEIDPSNDTPGEIWYANYVQMALDNAYLYADKEGNIHPEANLNRGELADMIYRLQNPGIYSGVMEYGKASFYGGRITEDVSGFTAAHKTLPFGTKVRVTHLKNNKTIEVVINDRGPYVEGRIIDLSSEGFEQLSSLGTGVIDVEIEILYN